jgi:hypothetical protein
VTEESRELLMRHFEQRTALHGVLARAQRKELAGIKQATELLEMARDHCPPAV